ncbi:histone-lysine N-methyltransferase SMYD1a [Cheilinus undulatus]|uniref:histone-lysine N-methyltransferase SMYD1a n=1 Tax=Cheilinus undulatus TaxID=241271 RepID=UPI001BD3B2DF|nr:histone-lysine N-methyltransferase SMYD1a [Cheilinus undulatus]
MFESFSPCSSSSHSSLPQTLRPLSLSVPVFCLVETMTVGNMESAELFDAGKKGRGLRATKELKAGDVVFAEPSFSAVVFDSLYTQVCHSCFRRQANLHRCAQCKFAHYCDRTCQTACWDEHKQECGAIRKVGAPSESVRLAARVLWRIHKDTSVVSDTQLVPVDQLEDHVSDLSEEDQKQMKKDVQNFQEYWSYGRKKHSVEEISHIFGIIKCNGFTLSDQRGLQAVGVGLFPNLCLVNHDCWPNCTVILNNGNQSALNSALHSKRRIELRAVEKISEGQELTVSYVDFLNLSADRQKKLKEHFFFDCGCEHCSKHVKDDLMMAAAESKPAADKVKEVTAFSKASLEKIERARVDMDYQQVLKLCRECLEKQKDVLADTHLYKLRVLSVASEVLSYQQKFPEAAGYAHNMVEGYNKLFHPNNAQLGMVTMRAGVTHWHAGQIEEGHGLICKAYRILMVTHGPNHAITKDLEEIREQTELELKMFKENKEAYLSMRDTALKTPAAQEVKGV